MSALRLEGAVPAITASRDPRPCTIWYINFDETTYTTVGIDRAWRVLEDVLALPRWAPSVSRIDALDGPGLVVGHRYRIKQPGLPPVVWRATAIRPGAEFTRKATSPGVHSVAYHRLSRRLDGATEITIGVRQTGVLSGLLGLLTASRTRRYLGVEAAGLTAAAEA